MSDNRAVQRVRWIKGNITDFERLVRVFNESPIAPRQAARLILTRNRQLTARRRFAAAELHVTDADRAVMQIVAVSFSTGNTVLEACYDSDDGVLLDEPWHCLIEIIRAAGLEGSATLDAEGTALEFYEKQRIDSLLWVLRRAEESRQAELRHRHLRVRVRLLNSEAKAIDELCQHQTVDQVSTAVALALEEIDPARFVVSFEARGHAVLYELVGAHSGKVYGRYMIAPSRAGGASAKMTWFAEGDDTDELYWYVMSLIHSQILILASASNEGAGTADDGRSGPGIFKTDSRQRRASLFKTIKDRRPELSYDEVAGQATEEAKSEIRTQLRTAFPNLSEARVDEQVEQQFRETYKNPWGGFSGHDVRNDYREARRLGLGWEWERANQLR